MSSKLENALAHCAIAAVLVATPVLGVSTGPAYAGTIITLTDSWTAGTATNVSESGGGLLPTLTMSNTNTSNDGNVTPNCNSPCLSSHAYTQPSAWSAGTSATDFLLVADPNNPNNSQTAADIPITFTLTDGLGGTVTFKDWIDYFAKQSTDKDSMEWFADGSQPSSPGLVSGTNNGAPSLVQTETLSDGVVIQVTLPYETDWNMAQEITYDYIGSGGGGGRTTVPEPSPLAVMGLGLVGLALLRWRPVAKSTRSS